MVYGSTWEKYKFVFCIRQEMLQSTSHKPEFEFYWISFFQLPQVKLQQNVFGFFLTELENWDSVILLSGFSQLGLSYLQCF